jgi:hypothetical protein
MKPLGEPQEGSDTDGQDDHGYHGLKTALFSVFAFFALRRFLGIEPDDE